VIRVPQREVTAGPVFSPDGRTLALATSGGKKGPAVRVIEWASSGERHAFPTSAGKAEALAFSPDGMVLASGQADTTILLWDLTGRSGPRPWLRNPSPLGRLWDRLRGKDSAAAGQALQELLNRPKAALALFRDRLRPAAVRKPDPATMSKLLARLGAARLADREAAARKLQALRRAVEPDLRQALAAGTDLEVRRRLEALLAALARPTPDEVFQVRCVEVLEHLGTPEAHRVLQRLAKGAPGARLTQEAEAALQRLAKRPPSAP
jgi:hypothetical protein